MAKRVTKSVTITARITPALNRKLEAYARKADRTKSQAVQNVMDQHLDYEIWFVEAVRKGLRSLEENGGVPHDEAMRRVRAHIARRKRERRKAA
jgi:predicted transcriptional regulator